MATTLRDKDVVVGSLGAAEDVVGMFDPAPRPPDLRNADSEAPVVVKRVRKSRTLSRQSSTLKRQNSGVSRSPSFSLKRQDSSLKRTSSFAVVDNSDGQQSCVSHKRTGSNVSRGSRGSPAASTPEVPAAEGDRGSPLGSTDNSGDAVPPPPFAFTRSNSMSSKEMSMLRDLHTKDAGTKDRVLLSLAEDILQEEQDASQGTVIEIGAPTRAGVSPPSSFPANQKKSSNLSSTGSAANPTGASPIVGKSEGKSEANSSEYTWVEVRESCCKRYFCGFIKCKWLRRMRSKTYAMCIRPEKSKMGILLSMIVNFFIFVSAVSFIMETLPVFHRRDEWVWFGIEAGCSMVFTIEWFIRLIVYPSICSYFSKLMTWIDILAVVPFYFKLITLMTNDDRALDFVGYFVVLRVLRIARMLRILNSKKLLVWRLLIYRTILIIIRPFVMLFVFYFMGMLIFSCFLFFAEREDFDEARRVYIGHDGNDSPYQGIIDSFWFSLVTMAQVGYGDVLPVSWWAKLVAMSICICGVLVFALPVSIIGETFHSEYRRLLLATSQIQAVFRGFKQRRKNVKQSQNFSAVTKVILRFAMRRRVGYKNRMFECGLNEEDFVTARAISNELALQGRAPTSYVDLIIGQECIKKHTDYKLPVKEFFDQVASHYDPVNQLVEESFEPLYELIPEFENVFKQDSEHITSMLLDRHSNVLHKLYSDLAKGSLEEKLEKLRRDQFIQEALSEARPDPWSPPNFKKSGSLSRMLSFRKRVTVNNKKKRKPSSGALVARDEIPPFGVQGIEGKMSAGVGEEDEEVIRYCGTDASVLFSMDSPSQGGGANVVMQSSPKSTSDSRLVLGPVKPVAQGRRSNPG